MDIVGMDARSPGEPMAKDKPEELLPLTPAVFHMLLALADGERHGYAIMTDVVRLTDGADGDDPVRVAIWRSIGGISGTELRQYVGPEERKKLRALGYLE